MTTRPANSYRPWPHRVAVALVCVVFPLIWIGGLVTTTDSGMAVPDWPGTYGYNLFLYPISEWFFGPWDLFVEHGHRLLGSLAGFLAIVLVGVTWIQDRRRSMRWAAVGLLLLVIAQGVLGGVRVLQDARLIAQIHGCVGPLFFAASVAFAVASSQWWQTARRSDAARGVARWSAFWLLVAYLQLGLGTFLRHIPEMASPRQFNLFVMAHISVAILLVVGTWLHWLFTRRDSVRGLGIRTSANVLAILILVQFTLGLATWVVKYGYPVWFEDSTWAATFVIPEKTRAQTYIVNGHVAVGSLIVAFWTVQAMRAWRITRRVGALESQDPKSKSATVQAVAGTGSI